MSEERLPNERSNETILQHFILAIIVLFEALIRVLNLIIPPPKKERKLIRPSKSNKKFDSLNQEKLVIEFIDLKSNNDILELLKGVDILSGINKGLLKELII